MSGFRSLGKLLDAFRSAAVAADLAALGTLTITAVGAAPLVGPPVVVLGAVAIAGIAGFGVYRDWRNGEKLDQITGIKDWLEQIVREQGRTDKALEEVLVNLLNDSDTVSSLPAGLTREPLALLLAIIQADGQERKNLLNEHIGFSRSMSQVLVQQSAEVLNALRIQREDLVSIRNSLRRLEPSVDWIHEVLWSGTGPPLWIPSLEDKEANRFIYSARRVSLEGRATEMEELRAFVECECQFCWSAWTGPGGMGKSRLALEMCLYYGEKGWDVGFYDWHASVTTRWRNWQPKHPTLIVFDYVQEHADQIREALVQLSRAAAVLSHPVRFLLLERTPPGLAADQDRFSLNTRSWWTTLLDPTHGTDTALIHSTNNEQKDGKSKVRPLAGLSREAVASILNYIAQTEGRGSSPNGTIDQHVGLIQSIDPLMRPLFVALAAEAIQTESLGVNWNADDLLNFALDKERKRWRRAIADHGYHSEADQSRWTNLLLLATMCGGISVGSTVDCLLANQDLQQWLPSLAEYGDGSLLAHAAPATSPTNAARLEPDMLGELFVLEEIGRQPARDSLFQKTAWVNAKDGFADFLVRVTSSFPQHPNLEILLRPTEESRGDVLAQCWSVRASRSREIDDIAMERHSCENLYALLTQPAKDRLIYPTDMLANLLVNLIRLQGEGADYDQINKYVDELREVSNRYKNIDLQLHKHLQSIQSQGLCNAVFRHKEASDTATKFIDEIEKIVDLFPDLDMARYAYAMSINWADYYF